MAEFHKIVIAYNRYEFSAKLRSNRLPVFRLRMKYPRRIDGGQNIDSGIRAERVALQMANPIDL
jgi:hypothetical protein